MTSVNESIVFDGLNLNDGVTYVLQGLEDKPPAKRQEWAQGADTDGALLIRDPLVDNRTLTLRVRVRPQATMDAALDAIAAISLKIEEAEQRPEGLALVRTAANATLSATYYVLSGQVDGVPVALSGEDAGWFLRAPVVTLTLTCKPFAYGADVSFSAVSSATPFVTLTLAGVPGDVPALGRLQVTDAASQNRRYVEWGLQQRFYDAATSLLVDSDDMVTSGFSGAQATRTGAYDPNAAGNNVIRANIATAPTIICATGRLSHVGTFRVKARCWFPSAPDSRIKVRLSWSEGDGPYRANPWASTPIPQTSAGAFAEVDLGLITIPPKQLGTQSWQGHIEAYVAVANSWASTLDIDYLVLVPAGEGYGKARSAFSFQPGAFIAAETGDGHTPGTALSGAAATVGGNWTTSGGAGDFAYQTSGSETFVQRTTTGTGYRYAVLPTTYTSSRVVADVRFSTTNSAYLALVARYVDDNNHLRMRLDNTPSAMNVFVETVVAGAATTILTLPVFTDLLVNTFYRLEMAAYPSGAVYARVLDADGGVIVANMAVSTVVATGGTLASGKSGLADFGSVACNRDYDNFVAAIADAEPIALYSGRTAEIRYDGAIRQDSTGTYYGPVPAYRGSPFLVPAAGDANRTSRILVKAHRNDIETAASDNVTDNLTAQVVCTPRYLVVAF